MSHDFGTIRISQQGKDQLIKLKRATGIKNWNTLCRWALCTSLADASAPLARGEADSNVEMTWKTFAGAEATGLATLVVLRASHEGESPDVTLHAHVHRGIGMLAGTVSRDDKIEDLLKIAL